MGCSLSSASVRSLMDPSAPSQRCKVVISRLQPELSRSSKLAARIVLLYTTTAQTRRDTIALPGDQFIHITITPASTVLEAPRPPIMCMVDCKDTYTDQPESDEKGEFEQEVADFQDGQLGICANSEMDTVLEKLVESGALFEDARFPADDSSLYFSQRHSSGVVWKRPNEMVSAPRVFVSGVARGDVVQGSLGDCWLLSSCAAIAQQPRLIQRVIDGDQPLYGPDYHGLVRVNLWRFGEWVCVYIDDRLPTKDGTLIHASNKDIDEFWVALLEKAYAKLHGSYEALEGGQTMDALVDLTGGLAERIDLTQENLHWTSPQAVHLFDFLDDALKEGAFVTCANKGSWKGSNELEQNGLAKGHAYTVTSTSIVQHSQLGKVRLLRVRNPWADDNEWTGAWSDGDDRWLGVSEAAKSKMQMISAADGEFWMDSDDFYQQFEDVCVCTLGPDFDRDGSVDSHGHLTQIRGQWVVGLTAGGCRLNFDEFSTNPQFLLSFTANLPVMPDVADSGDIPGSKDRERGDTVSVLVTLLQEHRRSQRKFGVQMAQIGLLVYKASGEKLPLGVEHFMYNYELASTGDYINSREVALRLRIPIGAYVLVPATYHSGVAGSFLIRVFSSVECQLSCVQPAAVPSKS